MSDVEFNHYTRGAGRPQIVLIGNGLEQYSGQLKWKSLLASLNVNPEIDPLDAKWDKLPFPLFYELLSVPNPAPTPLSCEDINAEEHRLKKAMDKLCHKTNDMLNVIPTLDADHIFTTNYSYCIEKAFLPDTDFTRSKERASVRFNLNSETKNGRQVNEVKYRIHSGYAAVNKSGRDVGIWHIHGECSVPSGIVLGHDRYGRTLSRIEKACGAQNYDGPADEAVCREFRSWPELFLYGDVYILGFGFNECEFDLWWLLKRKQRERYADGKVYFYEMQNSQEIKKLLLKSHGAELIDFGMHENDKEFDAFYIKALDDIRGRISAMREKQVSEI